MLEDRPLVQRSLVAAGAFGFVFSAAMAGTAFMLTGGFGFADENNPSVRSPDYGYDFAFAPSSERPTYVEAGWTQPSSVENEAPLEAWERTWVREDLAGEADARMVSLRAADIPDSYEMAAQETEDVYAAAERATAQALASYANDEPLPVEIAEAKMKDEGVY
jgi:hypothetical protein